MLKDPTGRLTPEDEFIKTLSTFCEGSIKARYPLYFAQANYARTINVLKAQYRRFVNSGELTERTFARCVIQLFEANKPFSTANIERRARHLKSY